MLFTVFLDEEQREFLQSLTKDSQIIARLCNRFDLDGRFYYAEYLEMDYFDLVLELKRIDKSLALYNRFIELGIIQDPSFRGSFFRFAEIKEKQSNRLKDF